MPRLLLLASLASASACALLAAACDTGVDAAAHRNDVSPSCLEADMHSDLEFIQAQVLTPTCANFTACHKGAATSAGGLNLEAGRSQAAMVGKPSVVVQRLGKPAMNLVKPGDPDASYLMVILEGSRADLIDPSVGTMPFNNDKLCMQKREAIRRWIQSLPPTARTM